MTATPNPRASRGAATPKTAVLAPKSPVPIEHGSPTAAPPTIEDFMKLVEAFRGDLAKIVDQNAAILERLGIVVPESPAATASSGLSPQDEADLIAGLLLAAEPDASAKVAGPVGSVRWTLEFTKMLRAQLDGDYDRASEVAMRVAKDENGNGLSDEIVRNVQLLAYALALPIYKDGRIVEKGGSEIKAIHKRAELLPGVKQFSEQNAENAEQYLGALQAGIDRAKREVGRK